MKAGDKPGQRPETIGGESGDKCNVEKGRSVIAESCAARGVRLAKCRSVTFARKKKKSMLQVPEVYCIENLTDKVQRIVIELKHPMCQ